MSQAQQTQLIPDRVKQGEAVAVPEKDKIMVSTNVAKLFFSVHKLLCGDSADSKLMRAEYYPIVKAGATTKAKTDSEDAEVKEIIGDFRPPALKMAYFNGKDANTYAETTKREETVFNRYLCDAYEEAFANQREPQLSILKYVVLLTSYHELAHVYFVGTDSPRDLSYQKVVQDITGMPDAMRLPDNRGESGWFLEYNITGGLIDIVYPPKVNEQEEESKYNARKYKEATGVHLVKYEKNAEKGYLDCKVFNIKPDALKRHSAGIVLTKFQPGTDMDLIDASEHVNIIKLEAIELSAEDLARNKK